MREGETAIRILIVDDEPRGLRLLECAVILAGGEVCASATDGTEAIALLESGLEIDLVLTDLGIGPASGLKVQRRANEKGVPCVIASQGYPQNLWKSRPTTAILDKCATRAIAAEIRRLLGLPDLPQSSET